MYKIKHPNLILSIFHLEHASYMKEIHNFFLYIYIFSKIKKDKINASFFK